MCSCVYCSTTYNSQDTACMLSGVCLTLCDPRTVARQAPLSMGFSRQKCWSGLLLPTPGDLLNPVLKLESPVAAALTGGFFITEPPGKPSQDMEAT